MPENLDRYLGIAALYQEYKHGRGAVSKICKEAKCTGWDVGDVKKLIERGLIEFDEEGNPSWTASPEDVEAALEAMKPGELKTAEAAVEERVKDRIASQAVATTDQLLTLGEVTWSVYSELAASKGWNLNDIAQNAPHIVFRRALTKEAKYDLMVKDLEVLSGQLRVFQMEADPLRRLRNAAMLINRVVELAIVNQALSETLGTRLLNLDAVLPYYNKVLSAYLKGGTMIV